MRTCKEEGCGKGADTGNVQCTDAPLLNGSEPRAVKAVTNSTTAEQLPLKDTSHIGPRVCLPLLPTLTMATEYTWSSRFGTSGRTRSGVIREVSSTAISRVPAGQDGTYRKQEAVCGRAGMRTQVWHGAAAGHARKLWWFNSSQLATAQQPVGSATHPMPHGGCRAVHRQAPALPPDSACSGSLRAKVGKRVL